MPAKAGGREPSMDIYLILRILIVGLLVSIFNQILKQANRDELAFLTSLAGLILVLFWLLPYISDLFTTFKDLFSLAGAAGIWR